jgi:type II secretory ATPase GspE/PulE/Tfp pilus assembly ATPase PilB-like protein
MRVTPEIRSLIARSANAEAIARAARQDGMTTLLEDGLRRVREGVTTVQELLRAASSEGIQ